MRQSCEVSRPGLFARPGAVSDAKSGPKGPSNRLSERGISDCRTGRPRHTTCGATDFQRISWDEALDEIAAKFQAASLPNLAARRSCLIPMEGRSGNSALGRWIAVSFTRLGASQLRAEHLRRGRRRGNEVGLWREHGHRSRSSSAIPSTSSPGPRTFTATMFICGRLLKKPGARARSWS